ncbi:DedA family protein [Lichenibacterium dinghuense]|uniref:DedA family protein n=1 Tax=Lichenibacterium dinghuense TaxID=2895977 RepID=UPI001F2B6930|nr:DedA family protein [Lichenibacterium sp. 6Y81]
MPFDVVAQVGGWIIGAISATGYLGVAGLMALESACLPLPSEVIMPFAGYLAATGRLDLALAATAGALGCNVGSTVAYGVGATGGRRFVERWGRYALLDPGDLDLADRFFARFGAAAVLVGRLLPVVRTFIALPAGIARMPQPSFQLFTFLGSWPWCFGLAYLGYALGARWDSDPALKTALHRADLFIVALVVAGIAWLAWRRFGRRRG